MVWLGPGRLPAACALPSATVQSIQSARRQLVRGDGSPPGLKCHVHHYAINQARTTSAQSYGGTDIATVMEVLKDRFRLSVALADLPNPTLPLYG